MDAITFLNNNSSAIFALLGALGAGVISLFVAIFVRRHDYSLRQWEKIGERRIQAHEHLLESAMELRIMVGGGCVDEAGEPIRIPNAMLSRDHFEKCLSNFTARSISSSPWQTAEAKREVYFIQDYMMTLYQTLVGMPSELYPNVGVIVRQDSIDLSSSLEKKVLRFFEKDILKLKVGSKNDWHKYPRDQTERRLMTTELLKHREEIASHSLPIFTQTLFRDDV